MSIFDDLKDIVTLSKDADISLSEAMNLYREYKEASSHDSAQGSEKTEPEKTEEQSGGKEQPDKALQNEPEPETTDNVIDYKSKVEELEEKIQKLQQENVRRDISNNSTKSNEELANEVTRSFM